MKVHGNATDITGNIYNMLTALSPHKQDRRNWYFKCACGNITLKNRANVVSHKTKSCGCYNKIAEHRFSHRLSKTRTYRTWSGMKRRCSKTYSGQNWKYYGGRGITYDPRWDSFEEFIKDMGEQPTNLELDRVDSNGNYEPNNCRWVTHTQNCENKKRTRKFTIDNETHMLKEWVKITGINKSTLESRIYRRGYLYI